MEPGSWKKYFTYQWLEICIFTMLLAGCSAHKPFNKGPYLAYGLGQNTVYVPIEPYRATENIRNALICSNSAKRPFVHRDLQEDRFIISNAILPNTQKSYEITVAWSFTGTLLHVTSPEAAPDVEGSKNL